MAIIRANIPNLTKPGRSVKKYCPWRDKKHQPVVIRRKRRRKRESI